MGIKILHYDYRYYRDEVLVTAYFGAAFPFAQLFNIVNSSDFFIVVFFSAVAVFQFLLSVVGGFVFLKRDRDGAFLCWRITIVFLSVICHAFFSYYYSTEFYPPYIIFLLMSMWGILIIWRILSSRTYPVGAQDISPLIGKVSAAGASFSALFVLLIPKHIFMSLALVWLNFFVSCVLIVVLISFIKRDVIPRRANVN